MERIVVAAVLIVVAVVVAVILERRKPAPPTQPRHEVPTQLDRADFEDHGRPWLVVLFTSATCESCEKVRPKAAVLESDQVAVVEVPYQSRKDLHERYAIDVVPLLLVVDPDGIVRSSFIGQPSATDLWAAVASERRALE